MDPKRFAGKNIIVTGAASGIGRAFAIRLAAGLIATPMTRPIQSDAHLASRLPHLQPLTGAMGQPNDIATAAAFLLSDAAALITGAVLTVNGGWTLQ